MADDETSQPSSPHEAMFFILAYLPLFELLSMAQVCKSLRDAVSDDIIPRLKLIVDFPLSSRLTDDNLKEAASKAECRLQSLLLIRCTKITDRGLLAVISCNPNITELHIPDCTGLTPQGVIEAAKLVRLKRLSISGIYFMNLEHFNTLRQLMFLDTETTERSKSKVLYHDFMKNHRNFERIKASDYSIDVDICPKCNEVRNVFDCARVSDGPECCCRGCIYCIFRCGECGNCGGKDEELEESACGDDMCLECWLKQPKCSFCNLPNCSRHADELLRSSDSSGFLCRLCQITFDKAFESAGIPEKDA